MSSVVIPDTAQLTALVAALRMRRDAVQRGTYQEGCAEYVLWHEARNAFVHGGTKTIPEGLGEALVRSKFAQSLSLVMWVKTR